MPPKLTMERGIEGETIFVLVFDEGSGAGWGPRSYGQVVEHLKQKIERNVEVIEAVYELERDYKSAKSFNALKKALRRAYEAW
jgi:hypothetical protein